MAEGSPFHIMISGHSRWVRSVSVCVVQYWASSQNVTAAVTAGSYRPALLAPGGAVSLQVRVTIPRPA
jgi:hypothetical protein